MKTLYVLLSGAVIGCFAFAECARAAVSIITQPQSTAVVVGDRAIFTVLAEGTGTLTYQWKKSGAPIAGATSSLLIIDPVTFVDAGSYTVDVTDASPSTVTSSAAGLSVNSPKGGDVDFTFGGASIDGTVYAVAVQSDGKVLIGGQFSTVNGVARGGVARLNSDGTTDYTFGNGLAGASRVEALAIQSDGKVLIGGSFITINGTNRGHIARLNSDGTLDTSFGNGTVGVNNHVSAVALQSDGKVLIGGIILAVNGVARGGIARLNSDGTLDTSFGNGLAGAGNGVGGAGFVYAVAAQSDGKVLIGGNFKTVNGAARGGIARLNSDGTLDTGFVDGLAGTNVSVYAVAMQSDGKVVVGGIFSSFANGTARNYIARLNSDGTLDTGFGNGMAGAESWVYAVAVQSDGKVLIGGNFSRVNNVTRSRIARLNSDGSLDTSFGNGLAGADRSVRAVAMQSSGKVLIGGDFDTINGMARSYAARLNSDGTLDTGFGNGLAGPHGGFLSSVETVAVQGDGKVLIGGRFAAVNGTTRGRIARLNSDGTLDTGFGGGLAGVSGGSGDVLVNVVAVQRDGRVVIGGQFAAVNGTPRGYIARLNSDGTLDTGFGNGLAGANSSVEAIVVQSDGNVLVGGAFSQVNGVTRRNIARLNSDGTLDTSFGDAAIDASGTAYAVQVQSDGKVLIGGTFSTVHGVTRGNLARLNSDGTLDTSFGNGLAGTNGSVRAIAVQSDGKVLIGGSFFTVNGLASVGIARLNSDGTSDTSFASASVGGNLQAVATQSNGKVLIGGSFSSVNGVSRGNIARLNGDGSLDNSFGNGLAGAAKGGGIAEVRAVAVQNDGKILIGGSFGTVNRIARNYIARLEPGNNPADLSALALSAGTLSPAFNAAVITYTASVSAPTITVTPTSSDPAATIRVRVNGGSYVVVPSGSPSGALALSGDTDLVEVQVTSADTSVVKTYSVTVTKPAPDIRVLDGATTLSDGSATPVNISFLSGKTFTITNVGTADLVLGPITKDGPNAADFTVGAPGITTLAAGNSTTFTVAFAPSTTGAETATIHIASNVTGAANPFDIALVGTPNTGPTISHSFANPTINEDGVTTALPFTVGDAETPAASLTVTGSSSNTALVPDANIFFGGTGANRTVTVAPAANASGTATITVTVSDGSLSASDTFLLTVNPVNDPPTFSKGADVSVLESVPAQSIAGWATAISAGPEDEAGQALNFIVAGNSNAALFAEPPAIRPDGTLTFTPAASTSGTSTVTVQLHDNGGTANSGVDTSAAQTFTISVAPVNNAPSFTKGANQTISANAKAQSVPSWATAISAGPAEELGQTLNFVIASNSNSSLFAVQPAIAPNGTLTYTPAPNASGTATIGVQLHDSGGTANGGVDASAVETFTIAVTLFQPGVYNGLVEAAPGTVAGHERIGRVRVTAGKTGSFSGKLIVGGASFSFSGVFDAAGVARFGRNRDATLPLKRRVLPDLLLALSADVSDGTDKMTGAVTENGTAFVTIDADRALYTSAKNPAAPFRSVPANLLGKYTVIFAAKTPLEQGRLASEFPPGAGCGLLTVASNGSATLVGTLGDGTTVSYSNALSKANEWPFYVALYKGMGSIGSWILFRERINVSDLDGLNLNWFKPAIPTDKRYLGGWATGIRTDLVGSKYLVPLASANESVFPGLTATDADGNAEVSLDAGNLPAPGIAKAINIDTRNKVKVIILGTDKLTVAITPGNGVFTGSYVHPVNKKSTPIKGVILQKQQIGAGFFLGPTEGGGVMISPKN